MLEMRLLLMPLHRSTGHRCVSKQRKRLCTLSKARCCSMRPCPCEHTHAVKKSLAPDSWSQLPLACRVWDSGSGAQGSGSHESGNRLPRLY